jgi:hypothetical protein
MTQVRHTISLTPGEKLRFAIRCPSLRISGIRLWLEAKHFGIPPDILDCDSFHRFSIGFLSVSPVDSIINQKSHPFRNNHEIIPSDPADHCPKNVVSHGILWWKSQYNGGTGMRWLHTISNLFQLLKFHKGSRKINVKTASCLTESANLKSQIGSWRLERTFKIALYYTQCDRSSPAWNLSRFASNTGVLHHHWSSWSARGTISALISHWQATYPPPKKHIKTANSFLIQWDWVRKKPIIHNTFKQWTIESNRGWRFHVFVSHATTRFGFRISIVPTVPLTVVWPPCQNPSFRIDMSSEIAPISRFRVVKWPDIDWKGEQGKAKEKGTATP